jgi:hypothetical protein
MYPSGAVNTAGSARRKRKFQESNKSNQKAGENLDKKGSLKKRTWVKAGQSQLNERLGEVKSATTQDREEAYRTVQEGTGTGRVERERGKEKRDKPNGTAAEAAVQTRQTLANLANLAPTSPASSVSRKLELSASTMGQESARVYSVYSSLFRRTNPPTPLYWLVALAPWSGSPETTSGKLKENRLSPPKIIAIARCSLLFQLSIAVV